ncbi:MAG: fibrobacter succinogenes major paralogous domain-containing protein, partial [Bacteroidales bacterium]|nr:fibrobacter succinogenes major paralogous domain-containing protein [Bacteroidales bacterium]
SAVPAGYCYGSSLVGAGNYAYFWSSTQSISNYAYLRGLHYYNAYVSRSNHLKYYGFSVRCLRDSE